MTTRHEILDVPVSGQRLAATLAAPSTNMPGILFVHGWGGSQARDLSRAREIAALGCVCLTFDLRGHAATSHQHETVTREQNLADILAAYDLLLSQPGVDRSSIAVIGSSYGGYLSAILSSLRPVRWLALRVPALYKDEEWDMPKARLDRQRLAVYRRSLVPAADNRALRACAEFSGDVLIVESEDDHLVPHQTIVSYRAAFDKAHSMTYRLIDGADHALSTEPCQRAYTSILLRWTTEMVLGARGGDAVTG